MVALKYDAHLYDMFLFLLCFINSTNGKIVDVLSGIVCSLCVLLYDNFRFCLVT